MLSANSTKHTAIIIALLVAASVFYYFYWPEAPVVWRDTKGYMQAARDLRDLSSERLPDRTPGYPILLLITGSSEHVGRPLFVVELCLHMLFTFALARLLFKLRFGFPSVCLFVVIFLLPPFVSMAGGAATENLTTFFLVISFVLLTLWLEKGSTALAIGWGFAGTLSALVRPTFLLLVPLIALFLILIHRVFRTAFIGHGHFSRGLLFSVLAWLLIVGGLLISNYSRFNFIGITPLTGGHLATKTARFVERLPSSYGTIREILIRERDKAITKEGSAHTGNNYIWAARDTLKTITGKSDAEFAKFLTKMSTDLILASPMEYLSEVARSFSTIWFPYTNELTDRNSKALQVLWSVGELSLVGFFLIQGITFLGGLFLSRLSGIKRLFSLMIEEDPVQRLSLVVYALVWAFVIYNALISSAFDIGDPRYRTPLDGLILMSIFVGIGIWKSMKTSMRSVPVVHQKLNGVVPDH
jgi:hypothetical protein